MMQKDFIDILKKLIKEQDKDALINSTKCKNLLRDYAKNSFKKETRFIIRAVEAGAAKAIDKADDLTTCKKVQIRELQKEQGFVPELATDIVNTLALVLRKDKTVTKPEIPDDSKKSVGEKPTAETTASKKSKQQDKYKDINESMEYFKRGDEYFKEENYDMAIEAYTKGIKLDPDDAIAYSCRGNAYLQKGNFDRAIEDCTQAIRLNPNNVIAYGVRGGAYFRKGDNDRAITDLDQAIRLNPNDASKYQIRGGIYSKIGDHNRAIADFDQAIRLAPDETLAYGGRAAAYELKGDINRAIADCEIALQLDPNFHYARQYLDKLRRKRGW